MDYNHHVRSLKYYPISLDITDKRCLVVGGGSVGSRKAVTLARCGAVVTVISPIFVDQFIEIEKYSFAHPVSCIKKKYSSTDLDSMFLVIGATDNRDVNRQIADDAGKKMILCNIADFPEGSSFVLPSIVQRGELVITVSTSGKSPALAKKLRKELESQFGQEYAEFLVLMGRIRKWLLAQNCSSQTDSLIFRQLVNSKLLEYIAAKDYLKIEADLNEILGSSEELMALNNGSLPSYKDFIFGE